MEQGNSFLLTLLPALSSLTYMMYEPGFSFARSIPFLLPLLIPLFTKIPTVRQLRECVQNLWNGFQPKTLEYTARLALKDWSEEPNTLIRSFSIVLWEWNRRNETVNCKNLVEQTPRSDYYSGDSSEQQYPIFVDDPVHPFWHREVPTILYTMWIERTHDRDNNPVIEICLKIGFRGTNHTPQSIVEHIDMIRTEAKRIQAEKTRKQRVLMSTPREKESNEEEGPSFMVYEFATTSRFENFYCEEAQAVREDLDHFLHNKESYTRIGRPWTYTILNEGPPGVGKTKLVKAIAAMTGSTLIVLNLSHIQTAQHLYEAFHTSILAGEAVPHDKRLYYIPEVDTQLSILKERVQTTHVEPVEHTEGSTDPKKVTKPSLTLGEILNVLDGIPERHGHILVLDTNHVHELDSALIRPGRIDRILKWQKMSSKSAHAFLENYYQTSIPTDIPWPDRTFSGADFQALVAHYSTWEEFYSSFVFL